MTRPLAVPDSGRVAAMRARLAAAQETWGERGEAVLDTGLRYEEGAPVQILVRKRGRRYDLNDRGAAVAIGGKPRGWLGVAERVVGGGRIQREPARRRLRPGRRGTRPLPGVDWAG